MPRPTPWIAIIALSIAAISAADSPALKNDRLDVGMVTVLALTDAQVLSARTKRIVVLAAEQRVQLQKDAGVAPTVLSVFTTKALRSGVDGCFLYNFAHWFEPRRIEVPHRFLVSDEEAAKKADSLDDLE